MQRNKAYSTRLAQLSIMLLFMLLTRKHVLFSLRASQSISLKVVVVLLLLLVVLVVVVVVSVVILYKNISKPVNISTWRVQGRSDKSGPCLTSSRSIWGSSGRALKGSKLRLNQLLSFLFYNSSWKTNKNFNLSHFSKVSKLISAVYVVKIWNL